MNHTVAEYLQHGWLKDEIYPGVAYQNAEEEDTGSGVEGQDVGDRH